MRNPALPNFQARQSESVKSGNAGMPARRNKESNAARHVRPDLRVQDLELLSEQRPQEQGQDDKIEEDARCCREALWRECRHFAKLIRLSHFAQKPSHGFLTAFARHPIDPARQSRQPTSLGDSQPGQADSLAHQYPLQDGNAYALKALLDAHFIAAAGNQARDARDTLLTRAELRLFHYSFVSRSPLGRNRAGPA